MQRSIDRQAWIRPAGNGGDQDEVGGGADGAAFGDALEQGQDIIIENGHGHPAGTNGRLYHLGFGAPKAKKRSGMALICHRMLKLRALVPG